LFFALAAVIVIDKFIIVLSNLKLDIFQVSFVKGDDLFLLTGLEVRGNSGRRARSWVDQGNLSKLIVQSRRESVETGF